MIPTPGRTITVKGLISNNTDEHPAIITRVHNAQGYTGQGVFYVNATVLPDMLAPSPRGSIAFYETRELALIHRGNHPHDLVGFWPDKV